LGAHIERAGLPAAGWYPAITTFKQSEWSCWQKASDLGARIHLRLETRRLDDLNINRGKYAAAIRAHFAVTRSFLTI